MTFTNIRLKTLLLGSALALGACGGGSGDDDGSASSSVTVTPSLGKVENATVTLYAENGTTVLGTAELGSEGSVTFEVDHDAAAVVEVSGDEDAMYYDEASQTMVSFNSEQSIRAIIPDVEGSVAVTALTEVAYQQAQTQESFPLTASTVNSINASVQAALAPQLNSILSVPTEFNSSTTTESLADTEAGRYALYLAALAELGSGDDSGQPALAVSVALAADLEDGELDGQSASGSISTPWADFIAELNAAIETYAEAYASVELKANATDLVPTTIEIDFGGDGEWSLDVTGTVTVAGSETEYQGVTAQNTTPPDTSVAAEVEEAVTSELASIPSVTNFSYNVTTNTSTEVVVVSTFDVVVGEQTTSYELTYTWTR